MAAWTTIPDSDLDPESPITTGLMQALRDNPVAIAGAVSGIPDVLLDATLDKIRFKTIAIGDWNMDSTATVDVNHTLTIGNIRSVSVMIRDDLGTTHYQATGSVDSTGFASADLQISLVDSVKVRLHRLGAGTFDNTGFNATSFNRGWVTIVYAVP